jgi:imidazolonepropionase-like amidohydrolase
MDEETVRLMVEHGTWLDGTVSALYCILRGKDKGLPEEFYQKAIDAEGQVYKSFNMAFHAGVPCAAGSDCGSSFCYHDESAIELVIMVEKCGITAMDAMVVGTINSARLCGTGARFLKYKEQNETRKRIAEGYRHKSSLRCSSRLRRIPVSPHKE